MKVFVLLSLVAVVLAGPPAKPEQAMQPVLPEKAQAHLQSAVDHWSLIEAALANQEVPAARQLNWDPTLLQQWYNDFLANLHNIQLPSLPTGTARFTLDTAQLQTLYPTIDGVVPQIMPLPAKL